MSERRYTEDEVATIFANAADAPAALQRPVSSGMTLTELQQIASEVGLSPAAVAHAAAQLDAVPVVQTRRYLGFPIGVARSAELGRNLTDAEWEQLVVELRTTFDARGRLESHGSLRMWSNGKLQALLEPTPAGHRLRLQTYREMSQNLMVGGLITLGGAWATLVASLTGLAADAQIIPAAGALGMLGLGMFSAGALALPAWAKRRRAQFDRIIARLGATPRANTPDEPQ